MQDQTVSSITPGFGDAPAVGSAVAELQQLLLATEEVTDLLDRLTTLTVKELPGDVSCGITLCRDHGPTTVAGSDGRASQVDEVQYGHRKGPCLRALATGQVVVVDDLADDDRWDGYRLPALGHGVRSSVSVPLHVGNQVLGALNVYATTPRAFGPGEQRVARRFADEASRALELVVLMADRSVMSTHLQAALSSRAVVDRAVGIIVGQHRCAAAEAFEVLRSTAQDRDVALQDVAADVLTSVGS